ncbi:MAG: hypothetical protein ACNA7X_00520 [Dehalococcoidia bacterium]
MEDKDLIRELENLETPDIDLPGHRQALRAALLDSDRFRKRTSIGWVRILAPVTAAVALMAVFGFINIVQPHLQITQAREIASTDARVQTLMTEYGLVIADVRLQDGEAFVLLAPQLIRGYPGSAVYDTESAPELTSQSAASRVVDRIFGWMPSPFTDERRITPAPSEGEVLPDTEDPFPGYVLRIDLSAKRVSGFLEITDVAALRDVDLTGAHFTESALPRDIGSEEPDTDM